MPEKQINLDRLAWLAQMAVNNAGVAVKAGLSPDETRAAVLLAVKLLRQAAAELMQHALELQLRPKAAPPHSPLDLKPGELN